MKFSLPAILVALAIFAGVALAQTQPAAAPSAVRILAPKAGDKLAQTFVTVQYELENPGIAGGGTPNFSVQLDGRDPVVTTETSQNFTGLTPGTHALVVQLVDANNTPVAGARAEEQFVIVPAATPTQPAAGPRDQAQQVHGPELPQSDAPAPATEVGTEALPASSSALPLLSLVGFGALLGGVISALRTR